MCLYCTVVPPQKQLRPFVHHRHQNVTENIHISDHAFIKAVYESFVHNVPDTSY